MKKQLLHTAILFAAATGIAASVPKQGGVCFRFDDNKPIQNWRDMAAVFEKHNARFGMSIIPQLWYPKGYAEMLRDMQQRGFEIMDHTPSHALFLLDTGNAAERAEAAKLASLDHQTDKRIFFKFARNPRCAGLPVVCDLAGKTATPATIDPKHKRQWASSNFLYDPQTRQAWRFTRRDGKLELRSFWNEDNVNLPERKNAMLELVPNAAGFDVPEEVLAFLAQTSKKRFEAIGVTPPVTYIQPGGMEPVPDAANIASVYGKSGYTGGATYPDSALRTYCEPDAARQRFAMMWGQFSLETPQKVQQAKQQIADHYARHQVAIGGGHMSTDKLPGGWQEFLKLHDELLAWCREKKIPIKLQKEWCRLLYDEKADPQYNIMPQPETDLDGNGVPDGYTLHQAVKIDGKKITVTRNGKVFEIVGLGGAERGTNHLRFRYTATQTAKLQIEIGAMKQYWNPLKRNRTTVELQPGEDRAFEWSFDVPAETRTLHIDVRGIDVPAPVALYDISITGK